jgi:L-cysteine:1D-myo-inositol 2-amino-2-deoxy-alpha-D-glucopyranoside ligase
MVGWQGHKMSKSRGNLVFVSALRHEGVDPMAIRLALLAHHYRADWSWTGQGLEGATKRLALWRMAAAAPAGSDVTGTLAKVRAALADDLRTPEALDALDAWAMANADGLGSDADAPRLFADIADALLGVRLS